MFYPLQYFFQVIRKKLYFINENKLESLVRLCIFIILSLIAIFLVAHYQTFIDFYYSHYNELKHVLGFGPIKVEEEIKIEPVEEKLPSDEKKDDNSSIAWWVVASAAAVAVAVAVIIIKSLAGGK